MMISIACVYHRCCASISCKDETFALVAKMNPIRILISLAPHFNWPLLQYDVKNAFLHGILREEIYMKMPPGYFNIQSKNNDVCKLKKAL